MISQVNVSAATPMGATLVDGGGDQGPRPPNLWISRSLMENREHQDYLLERVEFELSGDFLNGQ